MEEIFKNILKSELQEVHQKMACMEKIMEKMISVMRQAAMMKRYRPHRS